MKTLPIRLPQNLPAYEILDKEGVVVISDDTAERQDIRPLEIGLLNLMPEKEKTERQFARLIGSTPLQVRLTLMRITKHTPKNTTPEYLSKFYKSFDEIKHKKFDGIIITGAPIEKLQYEDVKYWKELCEIFAWTSDNVHSVLSVCWGAMAMLYYRFGIKKFPLKTKAFGCFHQDNLFPNSPYLRGISDEIIIPVSRWTKIKTEDINKFPELDLLLASSNMGPCLIEESKKNILFMLNHIEYETNSLNEEYQRDLKSSVSSSIPIDYFDKNNTNLKPKNRWRSNAHIFFGNWINEIYQKTPYDINLIGKL